MPIHDSFSIKSIPLTVVSILRTVRHDRSLASLPPLRLCHFVWLIFQLRVEKLKTKYHCSDHGAISIGADVNPGRPSMAVQFKLRFANVSSSSTDWHGARAKKAEPWNFNSTRCCAQNLRMFLFPRHLDPFPIHDSRRSRKHLFKYLLKTKRNVASRGSSSTVASHCRLHYTLIDGARKEPATLTLALFFRCRTLCLHN